MKLWVSYVAEVCFEFSYFFPVYNLKTVVIKLMPSEQEPDTIHDVSMEVHIRYRILHVPHHVDMLRVRAVYF
jgi:hypothetical protein